MLRIMLRPKWLALLALVLGIAVVFVLLSQWQLSRAVEDRGPAVGTEPSEPSQPVAPQPLAVVQAPQAPTTDAAAGALVWVEGVFDGSVAIIGDRLQGDHEGYWVVSRLLLADGVGLAVARGFTAELDAAHAVAAELAAAGRVQEGGSPPPAPTRVAGRFFPTEAPSRDERLVDGVLRTMSTAILVNRWPVVPAGAVAGDEAGDDSGSGSGSTGSGGSAPSYGGYLVAETAPDGLAAIITTAPAGGSTLHWLNLVYAIEWIVFAGFALFIWYRMVRDAWLEEQEQASAG